MAAPAALTRAWRSWNGTHRVHGVDLARALAVLGMLAAHLLNIETAFEPTRPDTWIDLVNGRSSVLFAVLAGVSLALATGGIRPVRGAELSIARRRVAVRAVALWIVGALLVSTGVPVYVILPAYAILFLLALPALVLPVGLLWCAAIVIAIGVPWLLPAIDASAGWEGDGGETVFVLLGWAYPFPLWSAFILVGLAVGRTDLRRPHLQLLLFAGGLVAAIAAGIMSVLIAPSGALTGDDYLHAVWSGEPHSGGILDAVGSTGAALAVLGGCLAVGQTPITWALTPLRAVGAMPLTAYVGQIVAWAVAAMILVGDTSDLSAFRELQPFWWFVGAAVVGCTAWALVRGRGPLEEALDLLARRMVPQEEPGAPDRVDR